LKGVLFIHPGDRNLSPGILERKKPLGGAGFV
jgi:hypothetical protein